MTSPEQLKELAEFAGMKIKLSNGHETLVDEEDCDFLGQWNWHLHSNGYVTTQIKSKNVFMHRLILNATKGQQSDHKNGNRLDNQRLNLRLCTSSQNNMNRRKVSGASKYKGVSWSKRDKIWMSQIQHNKISVFLGCFKKEKDAAMKYDESALIYHGKFAFLNFPMAVKQAIKEE